jgi:site-specific DNA-methyltransferase (adenine-specific)
MILYGRRTSRRLSAVQRESKIMTFEKRIIGNATLYRGDCLERMAEIPDGSVDMVLCDLPYGTMKGIKFKDTELRYEWDTALDIPSLLEQYNRVLRKNGALVLFGQEPLTSKLITQAHGNLPFSYRLIWKKTHFANPLGCKKTPVSYFEDVLVFFKKYDTEMIHPLRLYAEKVLEHCGGSLRKVANVLGHQGSDHFFTTKTLQFDLCTERTYAQICERYGISAMEGFKPFIELSKINNQFKRQFNLPKGAEFKSNILEFKKDSVSLHPTQKPVALLEDLIRTYSNEGDTVLDNCMGSASTGAACANTGRQFIGIEKEQRFFDISCNRLEALLTEPKQNLFDLAA